MVFLKISQILQETTSVGVSFLIKLLTYVYLLDFQDGIIDKSIDYKKTLECSHTCVLFCTDGKSHLNEY